MMSLPGDALGIPPITEIGAIPTATALTQPPFLSYSNYQGQGIEGGGLPTVSRQMAWLDIWDLVEPLPLSKWRMLGQVDRWYKGSFICKLQLVFSRKDEK
ncbi:UNVERIFIED_CONTAM: hypothetical protein K2H54_035794 [Gekko kuhli]